jgi:hypothetical protein
MFDVDRILAIPDQSVYYLQMGISGGERAALEKRGFIRSDGTKAKDYMIRTIQKTAKNKEKAIIKGDKKLELNAEDKDALERLDRLVELGRNPRVEKANSIKEPWTQTVAEYEKAKKPELTYGDTVITPDGKSGTIKGSYGQKNNEHVVGVVDKNGKLIGRHTKSELKDVPSVNNAKRETATDRAIKANIKKVDDFKEQNAESLKLVERTNKFNKALKSGRMTQEAYDRSVKLGDILDKQKYEKLKDLPKQLVDIQNEDLDVARFSSHRRIVKKALLEGKPVPDTVLKDYPDLVGFADRFKNRSR